MDLPDQAHCEANCCGADCAARCGVHTAGSQKKGEHMLHAQEELTGAQLWEHTQPTPHNMVRARLDHDDEPTPSHDAIRQISWRRMGRLNVA